MSDVWPGHYLATITQCIYLIRMSDALRPSQIFKFCQSIGQAARLPVYQTTKHLLYTHKAGWPLRRSMRCACIGVLEHVGWADHRPTYEIRANLDVG